MQSLHTPSDLSVMFDDDHAVANAGLVLVGLLSEKLAVEQLCDETISIAPFPGRRAATLVHSLVVGGTCIDDADVLRAGSTASVLSHKVMAPSTLGTFLRGFTFGHVRQLDSVTEKLLTRAWTLGAGPGDAPMTIDIDSTICEVHGTHKQGASYGYTGMLGYHPLLATRAETGEVLHLRFRKGSANTQRGAQRFVRETVGRVRRAGASGALTLRGDSGFFSKYVVLACLDHDVRFSITVRQTPVITRAIELIADKDWMPIDYTANGEAWVAETDYQGHRLIVRRTKLHEPRPALFPDYRYHAFVTDRDGLAVALDVAPSSRRRRARHPGPQRRLGTRALPLGRLQRQRRLGGTRVDCAQPCALGRCTRSRDHRSARRQDGPSQIHHGARSSHAPCEATPVALTYQLALGHPVEQLLRAPRQTADLTDQSRGRPRKTRRLPGRTSNTSRRECGSTRPRVRQSPKVSRPR